MKTFLVETLLINEKNIFLMNVFDLSLDSFNSDALEFLSLWKTHMYLILLFCSSSFYTYFAVFFSIFPLPFICVCLQYWRVTTSTYLDDNDEINLLGRVPRQEDPQNLSISAKNVTEMTDLFSSFIFLIVGLSFLQVKTIFSEFVIFQAYFEIN